jgi:uncharacterized protein (TIRG00374 family)
MPGVQVKVSRKTWLGALRGAVAAALVAWLILSGRLDFKTLAGVQLGWAFLGAVVSKLVGCLVPLIRWHYLVRAQHLELRLQTAVHIGLIGYFLAIIMPAMLGLDGARLVYGARRNVGRKEAVLSTILMDRLIGLVALILLAVVFGSAFLLHSSNMAMAEPVLYLAGVLAMGAAVAAFLASRHARQVLAALSWKPFQRLMAAVAEYRRHEGVLVAALLLSFLGHLSGIACAYFAFLMLNLTPPLPTVCAIIPLVNLSRGIPLTPMGLGVVDSVSETLFSAVGIDGGVEVSLVLRMVALLVFAGCGAAYLFPVARVGRTSLRDLRLSARPEATCD